MQELLDTTHKHHYIYCRDGDGERIKSFIFDKPLPLNKALSKIHSDKTMVEMLSDYKYFNDTILTKIESDISSNTELKSLKVKGMIDYGQTAYVFETEDGDILKITSRDHFLGRKETSLDNTIKFHKKLSPKSYCHYYIEEKTSHNVSQEEINSFIQKAKERGYKVVDNRPDQFGKTKDGEIVLIDPECLRKQGFLGLLKQKLNKIKSYAYIILKR